MQRATEDQIRILLLLANLELHGTGYFDAIGADVGDLGGILIDAIAAKQDGNGVGGRDAGAVNVEENAQFATEMAEGETVGDAVNGTGGDADVEETYLEATAGERGRRFVDGEGQIVVGGLVHGSKTLIGEDYRRNWGNHAAGEEEEEGKFEKGEIGGKLGEIRVRNRKGSSF